MENTIGIQKYQDDPSLSALKVAMVANWWGEIEWTKLDRCKAKPKQ